MNLARTCTSTVCSIAALCTVQLGVSRVASRARGFARLAEALRPEARSGQYVPDSARPWIAVLWCEVHRPRWSCARWAARTALRRRRRLPNSCRSTTTRPNMRATSLNMRCRRRWSIVIGAPRADGCSARPHTWTSIFPTAIIPRLVIQTGNESPGIVIVSFILGPSFKSQRSFSARNHPVNSVEHENFDFTNAH